MKKFIRFLLILFLLIALVVIYARYGGTEGLKTKEYTIETKDIATTFDGISLLTTLPAPITTLSPIVTPGSTTTFPPIQTLLPTFIGLAYSNPLFLVS